MEKFITPEEEIYFETVCLVNQSIAEPAIPGLQKLRKFCREGGLSIFVIKSLTSTNHYSLFLTKQNLACSMGYHGKASAVALKTFSKVTALTGNNVKRILSKSDSKFIERFSQLLTPQKVYLQPLNKEDTIEIVRPSNDSPGIKVRLIRDSLGSESVSNLPFICPNILTSIFSSKSCFLRHFILAFISEFRPDQEIIGHIHSQGEISTGELQVKLQKKAAPKGTLRNIQRQFNESSPNEIRENEMVVKSFDKLLEKENVNPNEGQTHKVKVLPSKIKAFEDDEEEQTSSEDNSAGKPPRSNGKKECPSVSIPRISKDAFQPCLRGLPLYLAWKDSHRASSYSLF